MDCPAGVQGLEAESNAGDTVGRAQLARTLIDDSDLDEVPVKVMNTVSVKERRCWGLDGQVSQQVSWRQKKVL
jgi:hypothetical protein